MYLRIIFEPRFKHNKDVAVNFIEFSKDLTRSYQPFFSDVINGSPLTTEVSAQFCSEMNHLQIV